MTGSCPAPDAGGYDNFSACWRSKATSYLSNCGKLWLLGENRGFWTRNQGNYQFYSDLGLLTMCGTNFDDSTWPFTRQNDPSGPAVGVVAPGISTLPGGPGWFSEYEGGIPTAYFSGTVFMTRSNGWTNLNPVTRAVQFGADETQLGALGVPQCQRGRFVSTMDASHMFSYNYVSGNPTYAQYSRDTYAAVANWLGGNTCSCGTPSFTPTRTRTATATPSMTVTPTRTSTATATNTDTATATTTSTATPTETATDTVTATKTFTATSSATPSASPTFTESATATSSATTTLTGTVTLTNTPSATPTLTSTITLGTSPTYSSSSTVTPSSTFSATVTATLTVTPSSTQTATKTVTFTATASATITSIYSATHTSSITATGTPTVTSSVTVSSSFTATVTATSTNSPTLTQTPTTTVSPTALPTPVPIPNHMAISIYNSAGERVRELFSGSVQFIPMALDLSGSLLTTGQSPVGLNLQGAAFSGQGSLVWKGDNDSAQSVSSGTYYFKIEFNDNFGNTTALIKPVQVVNLQN